MRYVALTSVLLIIGCKSPPPAGFYVPTIAVGLGLSVAANSTPDAPPAPQPGDTCPVCKGRGKVGDGTVMQKCLPCDGTGEVQAIATEPAPPVVAKPELIEEAPYVPAEKIEPQRIEWQYDYEKAATLALKLNRPLFIAFHRTGCMPCKAVVADVYETDAIRNRLFYETVPLWCFVRVNEKTGKEVVDSAQSTASNFHVTKWPSFAIEFPCGCGIIHQTSTDPKTFDAQLTEALEAVEQ